MRDFRYSILVTFICLALAGLWGYELKNSIDGIWPALSVALILGIMEVSLSFDNAVVNASILKEMDEKWRHIFLTVGILIAVFGVRLVFPLLLVAVATGQGLIEVAQLAINNPVLYADYLDDGHTAIAAFGGSFLFLVFLSFIFDSDKELHWLGRMEAGLGRLGRMESISIVVILLILLALQNFLPISQEERLTILLSGLCGVVLYVLIDSLGNFFSSQAEGDAIAKTAKRNGAMGFLYLEILDASFSFDGVIGAFAITRDVVIIMLGLTIGAMFVRSLTVRMVYKGTLDNYVYLEHGAHYAIGVLGLVMFYSIYQHVPEVITGLIGVVFIMAALLSSILYKRRLAH
ncbi:DUF475 domain-containing protein [Methylobacillus glycogenes]|uniref:DUF475 domain-containing protein n=1 Tax=Methylobacillus glycogenes TaxID=406 RepID=UPI000470C445|nr:DUF475 domain-containing protein [Methylobacillus glycogenes]MBL8505517.1 DUF475 domain-containing protein [Methylobacillus glycogenes]